MEILKSSLAYIKATHTDAAAFISDNISFTITGSSGNDIDGYTGATYKGDGWTVRVGHAIVPDYAYGIRAEYGKGKIVWVGTSKNRQLNEESYLKTD
ncbi:MAG: hypothetical protein NTZ34_04390 [Chloroflexi bacterium]|nr:hypothetical protein [Chloroflexota bacterium]